MLTAEGLLAGEYDSGLTTLKLVEQRFTNFQNGVSQILNPCRCINHDHADLLVLITPGSSRFHVATERVNCDARKESQTVLSGGFAKK